MRKSIAITLTLSIGLSTSYSQTTLSPPHQRAVPTPRQLGALQPIAPSKDTLSELETRGRSDTNGDPNAAYLAGRILETGVGAPEGRPNLRLALMWYSTAELNGSVNARYRIAYLRAQGITLEMNGKRVPNYPTEYDKRVAQAQMQDCIQHDGYNPATDALVAHIRSPRTTSPLDNGLALGLLMVGVAVLAAAASSGSATPNDAAKNTSGDSGTGFKSCMKPFYNTSPGAAPGAIEMRPVYGAACN